MKRFAPFHRAQEASDLGIGRATGRIAGEVASPLPEIDAMAIRERGRESLRFVISFDLEDVGALDRAIMPEAEDAVRSRPWLWLV